MSVKFFLTTAALLGIGLSITSAQTKPVYTEHDFVQAKLDFNRHTLVDAYHAIGHRDPKWDEPANKLLEGMAVYFTNAGESGRYHIHGGLKHEALAAFGKAALDAGCDDPQVTYCYAAVLDDMHNPEALPLLRKCVEAFPNSRYPLNRAFNAAARMLRHDDSKRDPARRAEDFKLASDLALTLLSQQNDSAAERRIFVGTLLGWFDGLDLDEENAFLKETTKLEGDPWMTSMIVGTHHRNLALEERLLAEVFKTPPIGWHTAAQESADAQRAFTSAYETDHDLPQPATEMISLASDETEARKWFDRATAAQFDYLPAYEMEREKLRPAPGGNEEKLMELARQCAASGRFDTSVPYQAIDVFWDIDSLRGADRSIWKEETVHRMAGEVLDGYASQDKTDADRRNHLSLVAAMEWAREDWPAARKALDACKGELDPGPLSDFHIPAWRIAAEINVCTGPHAEQVIAARKLADVPAAFAAFSAILKQSKESDPGAVFIFYRVRELGWQDRFDKGLWGPLPIGRGLAGWEPFHGKWTGSVNGDAGVRTGDYDPLLLCFVNFGNRYELSGTIDFDPNDQTENPNGGFSVDWMGENVEYTVRLRRKSQKVVLEGPTGKSFAWPVDIKDENLLSVRVWDGKISADVNHKPVFNNIVMQSFDPSPRARIGIGGQSIAANSTVKFRALGIRKLTTPPTATTAPATTH